MSIICAIHQPNFFPWLGYFDKIRRADIFVFLDDVQNIKTGGSWVNRVKLNYKGSARWYTCPIKKPSGLTLINQVEFSKEDWRESFLNVINDYYKNYPNFAWCQEFINEILLEYKGNKLADLNKSIIIKMANILGYDTAFVSKSDLQVKSNATEMLIEICKKVNADVYLCGGGAGGYQDDALFADSGLKLEYQDFKPAVYPTLGEFIPGLSIIDYFMGNKIGQ